MLLPVLHLDSFERTGQILPITEYFNPTINMHFSTGYYHAGSPNGHIQVSNLIKIMKSMATPDLDDDQFEVIIRQYIGSTAIPSGTTILRALYNRLPEEYKWLIFATVPGANRSRSTNTEYWKLHFFYPQPNRYNEFYPQNHVKEIAVTVDENGDKAPTEAQLDAFFAECIADETFVTLTNHWNTVAGSFVYASDSYVPRMAGLTYRFMNSMAIYYPSREMQNEDIFHDWVNTSTVLDAIVEDGMEFTYALVDNNTRIRINTTIVPNDRRRMERVLNYSANVLEYLPYTIKGPKEGTATLYGVELEANGDYSAKDLIKAQKDLFFFCKSDSSVYGSKANNYELVTVPASMKAHKRLWAEFFEQIDYSKFDCTKDTGNGMHVHIDRKAFSNASLRRFTWFMINPAHFDFMLAVSERPSKNNFNEWAAMPNLLNRTTKHKAARECVVANGRIRGAVHYKGSKTVEIRIFKGIVSYATIVKNIEFVDSIVSFTRDNMHSQLTLQKYYDWLQATPKNKYETLKTFIAELKMNDILAAATIQDYLWDDRNDTVTEEKLNKAPFRVTNAHITYLNKKRKKRTFVLKDGVITCLKRNGGLLAKLDKSVQQKQVRGSASFTMNSL